jgi:hypothetical protein
LKKEKRKRSGKQVKKKVQIIFFLSLSEGTFSDEVVRCRIDEITFRSLSFVDIQLRKEV